MGICKGWKPAEMETRNDRHYMEMVVRQSMQSSPGNSDLIALSSGSPIFSTDIVLEVGTMITVTWRQ